MVSSFHVKRASIISSQGLKNTKSMLEENNLNKNDFLFKNKITSNDNKTKPSLAYKIEENDLKEKLNIENPNNKEVEQEKKESLSSKLTPYLLLAALSFHGLFEGIALGLQKSFRSTFSLFIAISGHKWAESLTLGLSFAKTNTEKPLFIKMIVIFSFFTPVGIGLGMVLNTLPAWIGCVFMSLSVGTFIYIATSEIIVEEFSLTRYKWIKLLFFILGALLIIGLTVYEIANEEEGDEHHDHDHDHRRYY